MKDLDSLAREVHIEDKSPVPSEGEQPTASPDRSPPEVLRAALNDTLSLLAALSPARDLELGRLRRMLFYTSLIGIIAGVVGAAFFASVEVVQGLMLEELAGYAPLRAAGERFGATNHDTPYRPWLLVFIPMLGGLASGWLFRFCPEIVGGGTDEFIEAIHKRGALLRRRVAPLKLLASVLTLGTGSAGGREGPTILIGGSLGSWLGGSLGLSPRERRLLVIAGAAGGMAAVFRTPLGAALLAVEVLYRDGFESDALIPSILASVVSYSTAISIYGEVTLFGHLSPFVFAPAQLPLFAALALAIAVFATMFLSFVRAVRRGFDRVNVPVWLRPAVGGLLLGLFCVPIISEISSRVGTPGQGLGLLGGGYGAVQLAISGSQLLGHGAKGAELLALLCVGKLIASSVTLGSGASAGDFAPSLVLGGLFGGAFGRFAALLFPGADVDPSAFVLVGMAAFFGGIAHAPLSSLVLVCELAGSYDLLVPIMLAEGITFVLLRNRSLYHAQLSAPTTMMAPGAGLAAELGSIRVDRAFQTGEVVCFEPKTPSRQIVEAQKAEGRSTVFPVVDGGQLVGIISSRALLNLAEGVEGTLILAHDLMQRAVSIPESGTLAEAATLMLGHDIEALPVVDHDGTIIGLLHRADIMVALTRG